MNEKLAQTLKLVPTLSGCYIYYNNKDEVIYVGKAKNLKRRVYSYFHKKHDSVKVAVLVSNIERMEYIITDSEVEALILESHLIKKYKPKYNILLKDDKKYPYFLITDEAYPRIVIVRKKNMNPDKGRYYGPYTDIRAMHSTLDFLKKIFPLKQCKTPKFTSRPCLYYHIGRCMAPCQNLISSEDYKKLVSQVELFLSGRQSELLKKLKLEMERFAEAEQFEKAARLRDSYLDLQKTLERQKVVFENTKLNEDVISTIHEDGILAITILLIREGRLIDKKDFTYFDESDETVELFKTFFREYYSNLQLEYPDKIVSNSLEAIGEKELYQDWLKLLSNKNVKISYGKTKQGKELTELALKNARNLLETAKLKKLTTIRNDFNEVGSRRLARMGEPKWAKPNLVIIDGGKGQLSSVIEIVEELGMTDIDFVSLAKREEEVFLPHQSDPIRIPMDSNVMFLIQRIRDEAHRFAITYHRQLRSKSAIDALNLPKI